MAVSVPEDPVISQLTEIAPPELKKYLDFRRITLILEKSLYVGFLCVQGLSTQDNRKLKKEFTCIISSLFRNSNLIK